MESRKPMIILVTGAPGSGKSTLASTLADHMRLPHVERDVVLKGRWFAKGENADAQEGIAAYYDIIDTFIDHDVSLVTDGTMYKGISEKDVKNRLVSRAVVVNLHCRSANEHERFRTRESSRTFWPNDWLEKHMKHLATIYQDTVDPLDYGIDIIEVDTNDGYDPQIEDIAKQVMKLYDYATEEKSD